MCLLVSAWHGVNLVVALAAVTWETLPRPWSPFQGSVQTLHSQALCSHQVTQCLYTYMAGYLHTMYTSTCLVTPFTCSIANLWCGLPYGCCVPGLPQLLTPPFLTVPIMRGLLTKSWPEEDRKLLWQSNIISCGYTVAIAKNQHNFNFVSFLITTFECISMPHLMWKLGHWSGNNGTLKPK